MVLEGIPRKAAAEACGMDRQTLCDWVHRYNADGITGCRSPWRGLRSLLNERQWPSSALGLRQAPTLNVMALCGGGNDLAAKIKAEFDVEVHERTVGGYWRGGICAPNSPS